ncbi:uncharacterized protein LOC6598752 [Drosophila persimilis]|nr:uncharacterized protein LOC6598752 [Drosophila persimilis]
MFCMPFVMKLFMKNKWNTLLLMVVLLLPPLGAARDTSDPDTHTMNATCKHATDMWGDPNPNLFYICSADGQQPLQLQCPQGRGFFNGLGFLGCLPYDHWPACQMATAADAAVPLATATATATATAGCDSDSEHFTQPWPAPDPNQFYMCPAAAATPLLLNCAPGKGFVATSDAVGCADWSVWRRQMQCEDYY